MADRHIELPPTRHHQPPTIRPIDASGIGAAVVGTALWLVALAVCLIFREQLAVRADAWWISVCIVGIALGGLGLSYALVRRRNRAGWRRS